jgi:hypothetical protein
LQRERVYDAIVSVLYALSKRYDPATKRPEHALGKLTILPENKASRLCAGLVVEHVQLDGSADVTDVYGPSRGGSGLIWTRQRVTAFVRSDGSRFFHDD